LNINNFNNNKMFIIFDNYKKQIKTKKNINLINTYYIIIIFLKLIKLNLIYIIYNNFKK